MILAAWRLTELLVIDQIMAPVRKRIPSYLLNCQRCMSIWASMVTVAVYFTLPWLNWPLAVAWLYLWHAEWSYNRRLAKEGRQFTLGTLPNGTIAVKRSDFSGPEMLELLHQLEPMYQPPTANQAQTVKPNGAIQETRG